MPRNLVLIGMPSAGKSTLGVLAAKALGMDFLDTDILLQTLQGERLQALMARHGRERFLQLEAQAILSLSPEHTVIATGGSVVYDAAAMRHLKQLGRVVYLEVPFDEIVRRLADTATRGVVMREGQSLRALYQERTPLYERYADAVLRISAGTDMRTATARLVEAACGQSDG
jgi:shikimate kinase